MKADGSSSSSLLDSDSAGKFSTFSGSGSRSDGVCSEGGLVVGAEWFVGVSIGVSARR